jgi:hypothetical protein
MKTLLLTALLLSTSFLTASRATTPPTTRQIDLHQKTIELIEEIKR